MSLDIIRGAAIGAGDWVKIESFLEELGRGKFSIRIEICKGIFAIGAGYLVKG